MTEKQNNRYIPKWLSRLLLIAASAVFLITLLLYIFGDEIKEEMLSQLKQSSGLSISYEDADIAFWKTFPSLSLKTKHLDITPDSSAPDKSSFRVYSEEAWFTISLTKLISGDIKLSGVHIKNAVVNLVQKPERDPDSKMFPEVLQDLEVNEAGFENVRFNYLNSKMDTSLAFLTNELKVTGQKNDSSIQFQLKGEIVPLAGGGVPGEILSGNELGIEIELYTLFQPEKFVLESGRVTANKNHFDVSGQVNQQDYIFNISGKEMNSENIKPIVGKYYDQIKGGIDISGELDVAAKISGKNTDKNPSVLADFVIRKGSYVIAEEYPFKSKQVVGIFSNRASGDPSRFLLKFSSENFAGEELVFAGDAELDNLEAPTVKAKVDVSYYPQKDDFVYDDLPYYLDKGEIKAHINFKRKRQAWNAVEPQDIIFSTTNGKIISMDVPLYWRNSGKPVQLTASDMTFNNSDMEFDSLLVRSAENKLILKGKLLNVFAGTMTDDPKRRLKANIELYAPLLLPEELISIFSSPENANNEEMQPFSLALSVNVDSLQYKKFTASGVKGQADMTDKGMQVDELKLKAFDGFVELNGDVTKNGQSWKSKINAEVARADINKLFLAFDDFGMTDFTHENIQGFADATITYESDLSSDFDVVPGSIETVADVTIRRGNLRDFHPIMDALSFLDEDNLDDIHFSKLQNRIRIKDEKVHIPEMNIESDVLDVEAYGTHSFSNEMDYHMRILLSDILSKKARHRKEQVSKFGEIEDDGLGRTSLYFHLKGNVDDPQFVYDSKAVANKMKEDFQREKQNTIEAFRNEFSWLTRDSLEKAKAEKRKQKIKKQEEGEFLFEWDDGGKEPN